MLVSIPPKYAVAQVIGYIKGKSAIHIAKNYFNSKNASGHKFWARGYHVSTVGRDEEVIRRYIKEQEKEDQRVEQLSFDDMGCNTKKLQRLSRYTQVIQGIISEHISKGVTQKSCK